MRNINDLDFNFIIPKYYLDKTILVYYDYSTNKYFIYLINKDTYNLHKSVRWISDIRNELAYLNNTYKVCIIDIGYNICYLMDDLTRHGCVYNIIDFWKSLNTIEKKEIERYNLTMLGFYINKYNLREDIENMKFRYMPIGAEEMIQLYTDYKSDKIYKDSINQIQDVIHHDPATIVKWKDGTKTVVKVQKGDTYNKEFGLAMCIIKKMCGNKGNYNEVFKKWCK